jgi:hypothetical protein
MDEPRSRLAPRPLLAVAVEDKRALRAVILGILIWAFLACAITSILRGSGAPFDYVARNFSVDELRIALWGCTGVLTLGIIGVGGSFVQMGRALWRDTRASSFGLRFTSYDGHYAKMVQWYGGLLVVAGLLMIPLGASLLWILSTCRYMRDI